MVNKRTSRTFIDQIGREIEVPFPPQRIISIVPSQTELLYDLGLDEETIGITKFCVHPASWYKSKTRIGGTKNLWLPTIQNLKPDLIIGNKEENVKTQISWLEKRFPVWISDVKKLDDALQMIKDIGEITGKTTAGAAIADEIKKQFESLPLRQPIPKVAYLIWQNPYMVAGGDTFIHDMLQHAGFENVFKNRLRYPTITKEELRNAEPDLIFLSSEPFPFREKHMGQFQEISTHTKVVLVDGELFSWYGSRMLKSVAYFKKLSQTCQ